MVVFQKLEGKTTTLNFWNQKIGRKFYCSQKLCFDRIFEIKKNGRKFYYSQKLCFDRIFEIKKMEGNSTTPENCVLTEFLHERSTIFLLVFSLIRFWILLRNAVCIRGRGLPINRLIGLSRSFSLIGLGIGHLIFWPIYLA